MTRLSHIVTSLLFLVFTIAGNTAEAKRFQKVVFILIDGIPKDVIEKVETPNIDAISAAGGYFGAHVGGLKGGFSQTPTISAPGYNALITGTWGHKNNVNTNSIKNPNYNYWNIFRIVEEVQPEKVTAVLTSWTDNRTKLVGDGLEKAGNLHLDYSYDGFDLDEINHPKQENDYHIFEIDELVSKRAEAYITSDGPDLTWVYLWYPDDAAHMFGDGEYFYEHVAKADVQVGRIWRAIQKRMHDYNEDWMIVVTTDHGRTSSNGKGHGGQSDRERTTWISTNIKPNKYALQNPGITSVVSSIIKFMDIDVPDAVENELDGVAFIGDISLAKPVLQRKDKEIQVSWTAFSDDDVEVYVANTNAFSRGGADRYKFIGKTNAREERFSFSPTKRDKFQKILLKSKNNRVNVWWGKAGK